MDSERHKSQVSKTQVAHSLRRLSRKPQRDLSFRIEATYLRTHCEAPKGNLTGLIGRVHLQFGTPGLKRLRDDPHHPRVHPPVTSDAQMEVGMKNLDTATPVPEDFRFVLDAFLKAYRPILEDELKLASSANALIDAAKNPPTCADEIQLAHKLFEPFFTKEVALRLLSDQGRTVLGASSEWALCYRRLLCCLIFGWLVCRGPRTFRGFSYYLYEYWLCVRRALDHPVSVPPTIEEKRDFATLLKVLASAYRPVIDTQIKDLDYPVDIPSEIVSGAIDCHVDDSAVNSVFARLCTRESAAALFGAKAVGQGVLLRDCCCYCIAALEFGCCLAQARTLVQAVECLKLFFATLRRCFEPLIAELDTPPECAAITLVPSCSNLMGIEITGTAAGASFTSYALSYSFGGPASNDAVVYPDCTTPPAHPSSTTPVTSGILGYLNVGLLPPATTSVTVYLDVYGSGGLHLQVSTVFQFQINAVEITAVAMVPVAVQQDPFNASPSIIKLVQNVSNPAFEQSIGGLVSITGSAYAFGCGKQMTDYQLAAFGPATGAIPLPSPVPSPTALGGTPIIAPVVYDGTSVHPWASGCVPGPATPNTILNGDLVAYWTTENCTLPFPPFTHYTVPHISSNGKWNTAVNGRYLVFLEVDEGPTSTPHTPVVAAGEDQVAVWIDNFSTVGALTQIGNVVGCGDLHLSDYVGTTAQVLGVAWDYPIDILSAQQLPNDNFSSYSLSYQKNGGTMQPFLPSDYTPNGVAGPPSVRVPNLWQASAPNPLTQSAVLASWDIVTALDGGAAPDPNFPCIPVNPSQIPRGCRCAYVIELVVSDSTWVGDGGNNHSTGPILFALNIINDIPAPHITCSAVTTGSVGAPFSSVPLGVDGGVPPYTFAVTGGTLPPGLSLNTSTGAVTGTPAAAGTFTITIQDAHGVSGNSCTITIS